MGALHEKDDKRHEMPARALARNCGAPGEHLVRVCTVSMGNGRHARHSIKGLRHDPGLLAVAEALAFDLSVKSD